MVTVVRHVLHVVSGLGVLLKLGLCLELCSAGLAFSMLVAVSVGVGVAHGVGCRHVLVQSLFRLKGDPAGAAIELTSQADRMGQGVTDYLFLG